jgi:hypothetical protein
MGADGSRVSTFCFSIWLHIQLDVINLAMCISSTFIYKFSVGKPGRTNIYVPHFGKPYRWTEMAASPVVLLCKPLLRLATKTRPA